MGDFNTPLFDEKKSGGLALDLDSKIDLSNFINSLTLLDIDLFGGTFTWSNRHLGSEFFQVHLDWALISPNWLNLFSRELSLLPKVGFDHSPISLSLVPLSVKQNFPFCFEKMWISHMDLLSSISSWWNINV